MLIIQQDERPAVEEEHQVTKTELFKQLADLRRAQSELAATGNGDLIVCSLLEFGQMCATLRFRFRVSDLELAAATEVL